MYKYKSDDFTISKQISRDILKFMLKSPSPPVIVCIGSDRITGDCLGPMVGHMLTNTFNSPAFVYGTLFDTVTALNLTQTCEHIKLKHAGHKILAVDACLGAKEDIGLIKLAKGGLFPGSASGKKFFPVGDYNISANVNISCDSHELLFQNTKLSFIFWLSTIISQSISDSLVVHQSIFGQKANLAV